MTKQRILFITTGGTIASVRTQQGLKPVLTSEELLAHLPELKELCCPKTLALCSIDSTDLGQEHWLMMARAIQENYALYDGFIICHGTDTLAYSAAALSYLIMMHIGFVLLVIGFVRLDAACGAATFGALGDYFRTQPGLPLLLVFLAGFGMKAGLFPMHVWLPEAHPAAPSHVSALMSGVMIKTGVYGILRVTAALGEQPLLHTAGVILLAAGGGAGPWGAGPATSSRACGA